MTATPDEGPERVDPDLLPIDWVDKLVCADTAENRRLLRENGDRWAVVDPPDGEPPTGLIEVRTADARNQKMHDRYRDALVDPRDPWSDYLDPRELPIDVEGVPYWVHRRAAKWRAWDEAGRVGKHEPEMPVRCVHPKRDGTRCWAWSMDGNPDRLCRGHAPGYALANNAGHQIMVAKLRIVQSMPAMVSELEDLAYNAASEPVRLKAITEMMDRGGVNAQTDVNVTVGESERDPAAEIRGRLADLGARLAKAEQARAELEAGKPPGDIVDAEVVSEEGEPA